MADAKELTVIELMELLDSFEDRLLEISKLSSADKNSYSELLKRLKLVNSSEQHSHNEKGKVLEKIVSFIISKSAIFEIYTNIHTSSNEIDQLVILNKKGKLLVGKGLIDIPGINF